MKRVLQIVVCVVAAAWAAWLVGPAWGGAGSGPSGPQSGRLASIDANKLRVQGIESALAGRFDEGLEELRRAVGARPADHIASEALDLLKNFDRRLGQTSRQRKDEYADAVERVQHARVAQAYMEKADEKLLKKLRDAVKEIGKAYSSMATADALDDARDANAAASLKADSIKYLGKAIKALGATVKVLDGQKTRYAEVFRSVAAEARKLLERHRAAWQKLATNDESARRALARRLKELEYDEIDVLGDLESMAYEKPWRAALGQARLARKLAEDKEKFASQAWFRQLIDQARALGKKFVDQAEWYDALAVYASM
ncbi:MAG: hypothetical protein J7M21_04610, partial [Planctomycetes bacterium]|nr:hypothetical protein [Planctomycetota bacterium]